MTIQRSIAINNNVDDEHWRKYKKNILKSLQNNGEVLKDVITVRNKDENRLDAKLNRSKHVNARNRTNDVDRLNDPHMRTRKTNVFNRMPTTKIV